MNSVIIPEENARIIMKDIKLKKLVLNKLKAAITEIIRIVIDRCVGFIGLMVFIANREVTKVIFPYFLISLMIYKIIVTGNF